MHVVDTLLPQPRHHLLGQADMRTGEHTQANHIHIFLNCRLHNRINRVANASVNHFHARVTQHEGHGLGSSVMAVEAGLSHQNADLRIICPGLYLLQTARLLAGDHGHCGVGIEAEHIREGFADFANSGIGFDRLNHGRHDIGAALRRCRQLHKGRLYPPGIALAPHALGAFHLPFVGFRVRPVQLNRRGAFGLAKFIHPHHHLFTRLHALLFQQRRAHNALLYQPGFNRTAHPDVHHLVDDFTHFLLSRIGQRLHVVRTRQGIYSAGQARFVANDLLRAQGNELRFFSGNGIRFVIRAGVHRLRPAQGRRHHLNRHPHDIVERLFHGQGVATTAGVKPQHARSRVFRLVALLHQTRPQSPGGSEAGCFFK